MPKINILNIGPGDNQTILIDKINYNFDQILTAGGGPQGPQGTRGATGAIGPQGIQGPVGPQGQKGARWYVQSSSPGVGTVVNSPWGEPELGDYWLADGNDPNPYGIYVYNDDGTGALSWQYSGIFFNNSSVFTAFDNTNVDTDRVILHDDNKAPNYSLVVSDYSVNGTDPNYLYDQANGQGDPPYTQFGINSEKAKLKIATDHTTRTLSLLSFGRANMDNANGNNPVYSKSVNPRFEWTNLIQPDNYDIKFNVPNSNYNIEVLGAGKVFYSKASSVNIEGINQVNITGPNVSIRRNGANNLFNNYGTGDYYAEGNKIRYKPDYNTSTGNFIVGSDVSTPGSKGIVISSSTSSTSNGNSLIFKSLTNTVDKYYGRIIAEKQSSALTLAGIGFAVDLVNNTNNTRIDFSVSNVSKGLDINRLTLDSNGNLQFKFGSLTGSSKNAKIYMQIAGSGDPGANLSIIAGDAASGLVQGGSLDLNGGIGGTNSGKSGNVIINPGNTVKGITTPNSGGIYLHNNFPFKGNTTGVAIGIDTASDIKATFVVADVNTGLNSDILQLKTDGQRLGSDYFFGFDSDGYVSRGLPYNPDLYNGTTGYKLSNDPNNLDYYIEGDWSNTFSLRPRGDDTTTGWDSSYLTLLRSRFTRIGDTVQIDFVAKVNITNNLPQLTSPANGVLYISGLPYKPDFDRGTGNVSNYLEPVMPRYDVKASNVRVSSTSSIPQSQIPAGTIIAWPGSTTTIPTGWKLCDGSSYNRTQQVGGVGYPELFNAIGTTYGAPSPSTFKVPDFRGKFLRGLGTAGVGQSSSSLGVVQSDVFKAHTHSGHVIQASGDWRGGGSDSSPNSTSTPGNVSTVGDTETRPVNMAVNYIIYMGSSSSSSTTTTTSIPQMDLGAAFVYENSTETRLYLYNDGGTFNLDSFPINATSYISGCFSYFTLDSTPYTIPTCGVPTAFNASVTTGNQLKFTWNNGTGNPTTFVIEASLDNSTWITLHNNLPATSPGTVILTPPPGYPKTTGDLKTYFRITQYCGVNQGSGFALYTYQGSPCVAPIFNSLTAVSSNSANITWTTGTGVTDPTAILLDYSTDGGNTWTNTPGGFAMQTAATSSPYQLTELQNGWRVRIRQICISTNQPVYGSQVWQFNQPTSAINQYVYLPNNGGLTNTSSLTGSRLIVTLKLSSVDPTDLSGPIDANAACAYDLLAAGILKGKYAKAGGGYGDWIASTTSFTGSATTIAQGTNFAKFYIVDVLNPNVLLTTANLSTTLTLAPKVTLYNYSPTIKSFCTGSINLLYGDENI